MENGLPSVESGIDMTEAQLAEERLKQAEHEVKPAPKKVSSEDLLRVENVYLKLTNCKFQEEVMKRDAVRLQNDRNKYQQELTNLSLEYAEKYGIILGKAQVMPDGTIVTTGDAQPNGN